MDLEVAAVRELRDDVGKEDRDPDRRGCVRRCDEQGREEAARATQVGVECLDHCRRILTALQCDRRWRRRAKVGSSSRLDATEKSRHGPSRLGDLGTAAVPIPPHRGTRAGRRGIGRCSKVDGGADVALVHGARGNRHAELDARALRSGLCRRQQRCREWGPCARYCRRRDTSRRRRRGATAQQRRRTLRKPTMGAQHSPRHTSGTRHVRMGVRLSGRRSLSGSVIGALARGHHRRAVGVTGVTGRDAASPGRPWSATDAVPGSHTQPWVASTNTTFPVPPSTRPALVNPATTPRSFRRQSSRTHLSGRERARRWWVSGRPGSRDPANTA